MPEKPVDSPPASIEAQAARYETSADALLRQAELDAAAEGMGQSHGVPAEGRLEGHSFDPTGGPSIAHWQEGTISNGNLSDRGGLFFAAVEMTRMPMIVTDPNLPDCPIVFANGAFSDLTGYSREETYGRNCRFLQGALSDKGTITQIRTAIKEHKPLAVELLNYRKDGTRFWNALFLGPIFDEQGKLLYFFASQLDVTRRRNSEDSFRQSQKMEAIGQLTAGMAHDFNNALHVILGNLKRLIANSGDPELVIRSAERAIRAAEHTAKLTKQLVTFARKTRLEPLPVDLSTVVRDFGQMLDKTLGGKIEVAYDLAPDLPMCVLDLVHAEMALLNVLANARDALPNGGKATVTTATIHLDEVAVEATGSGLKAGQFIILTVADNGQGMPPDVLARAVEPFFTTKKDKGTGLGLAMVHGFVRQSGGWLDITSETGHGTTVRMVFPVATDDAPKPLRPIATEVVLDPRRGAETILVVEDNEDVLELAVHALTKRGYNVLSAASGEQALHILQGTGASVDLMFSDIIMPGGITGLVLAERAREMFPTIRILLATGYNEELVNGSHPHADDVLSKPYQETDMASRVRSALNRPTAMPRQKD